MTDKIQKNLAKFSKKERAVIAEILTNLTLGEYKGLNLLKLKGSDEVYRVRKRRIRIIFRLARNGKIKVLAIERRSEKTYKDF